MLQRFSVADKVSDVRQNIIYINSGDGGGGGADDFEDRNGAGGGNKIDGESVGVDGKNGGKPICGGGLGVFRSERLPVVSGVVERKVVVCLSDGGICLCGNNFAVKIHSP